MERPACLPNSPAPGAAVTVPQQPGFVPPESPAGPPAADGIVHRFAPDLAAGESAAMVARGLRVLAERRAARRPLPDRVCWSRISYRQHFRPTAALREIRHADGTRTRELTVDLGQAASPAHLARHVAETLDGPLQAPGIDIGGYRRAGESPIWDFNAAFWHHLPAYMAAVGRNAHDSIGGSPDSDPVRTAEHARRLCARVRRARGSGGAVRTRRFAYLDVGAADTGYAETMIRHLARLGAVDYVVADRSPGALHRARARLGQRRGSVSVHYAALDVTRPGHALEAYRGRILGAHLTNLLDNLPGDELVQIGGRHYLLHTSLYLPAAALRWLAARHRLNPGRLATDLRAVAGTATGAVDRFLQNCRDRFAAHGGTGGERGWYLFWQDLFGNPEARGSGLRLRERLVEVADPDGALPWQAPAGALPPEVLAPGPDRRIPLSDRAIGACLRLIGLLHPHGVLEITDIMIRDRGGAAPYASYHGPAKYDGSVVHWFNGGLFRLAARRAYPECSFAWRSLGAARSHMTCLEVHRGGR